MFSDSSITTAACIVRGNVITARQGDDTPTGNGGTLSHWSAVIFNHRLRALYCIYHGHLPNELLHNRWIMWERNVFTKLMRYGRGKNTSGTKVSLIVNRTTSIEQVYFHCREPAVKLSVGRRDIFTFDIFYLVRPRLHVWYKTNIETAQSYNLEVIYFIFDCVHGCLKYVSQTFMCLLFRWRWMHFSFLF